MTRLRGALRSQSGHLIDGLAGLEIRGHKAQASELAALAQAERERPAKLNEARIYCNHL